MEIGAQFFTVREFCKDLEGFSESLKKVADIGYKYVQISGTCPFEPEWLKKELEKNDLKCVLTHTPPAQLTEDPVQVAKNHSVFGCDYVGLGYYRFDETDPTKNYANYLATYKPVAKALHENGKYFMHHNHSYEYQKLDGKLVIERLAEEFSADILGFTLDTYWVQKAGGDPAQWIEKMAGRLPVIHLKDYAEGAVMSVVGEGNINFDRVFEKAETAGVKYMLVEQDNCNGEDPFACLNRSYQYLKARGF